ncbi:bZIP transcription factor 50-like [Phragmites australis]|uniref:bZIP transcription factor 50-like n=1 Tax=Phragmites australis TaxID=29695 RepID=UPI002D77B8D4|nr:bZIP transcription factor 50-like [Phragmites australis]
MAASAPAAAGVGGGGDRDLPLEEVNALLASFSSDPPLPAPVVEAGTTSREQVAPGESLGVRMGDVERFLMEDDADEAPVDGVGVDEFLDGILAGEDDRSPLGGTSMDGEAVGVDADDDPNSKKKRRQMRNRDSAMKSRDRKKLYIKDLEMKSKYLEAECCRLSYALQCCTAENVVLRQCLLKDRPVGAPTAMQESAVLTETLPLVSLLWLVSIVCLFPMPSILNRSPVAPSSLERDPVKLARMATNGVEMTRMTTNCIKMTGTTTNGDAHGTLELICHGRRCKGRRAKMKVPWLPWHVAAAC